MAVRLIMWPSARLYSSPTKSMRGEHECHPCVYCAS